MRKILKYIISIMIIGVTVISILSIYQKCIKVEYPWYFDELNITKNKKYGKNKAIGVAIIDSGFNDNCEKFFENEVICYDLTGANDTADYNGHGTQMALLIGSNSSSKNSIYGVNPYVQIYSLKINNSFGITTTALLHKALELCIEIDVSIINISLGGNTYSNEIDDDITRLKNMGKYVICSAGDTSSNILFPADYLNSYCIASQNKDSSISPDSNSISINNKFLILCPGVDIPVLIFGNDGTFYIDIRSGSSFSTAIFSGYLSLLIAKKEEFKDCTYFDSNLNSSIYSNGFLSIL